MDSEAITLTERVPCRGRWDVLVAGGGVAGIAAALAARRAGKSVLLLEKSVLLGGLATIGLVNFFVPMCNGRGRQIVTGMAEELLRLSIRRGYDTLPPDWRDGPPDRPTKQRYCTFYSAQIFALELTELVLSEGVELLFDCLAARPAMEGNHCLGVVAENKSGREFYRAGMVVDATGDCDLLVRAGVPTVDGTNFYTYYGFEVDEESRRKSLETGRMRDLYRHAAGGPADLYGKNQPAEVPLFKGAGVREVNRYLAMGQRDLLRKLGDGPREGREVATLPTMPQFRTTRRIDGKQTLNIADAYKHFPDSVGAICDFDRRDVLFEVPYGALIHPEFDNLITAGRTAAGVGYAWDVLRVIPPAILTGEAAGRAAALALESGRSLLEVDIGELQKRQAAAGVTIHFDDQWLPANREDAGENADVGHL